VGEAPPAATAGNLHGFPAMRTSFIGRAEPARELSGLLEQYQLVTVTGPGGAGKTRLAGEVARQVADRFADGAWLVELAPVQDPEQVPGVVATALGVRVQSGVAIAATLAQVLARQQLLLVLDNCEHVLAAAAGLCAELVTACDDLRILVTSREALRIAGEARYRLGPLTMPDPDDLAAAAATEAVALFADRARQADAHFVLDEQSGPEVARLVTRLDGMPLAIELAAARAEALGVSQLRARLEDRFALLAEGDRLAPPRHRSLAGAVDWSYRLLDESDRRAFRTLSVFPGPFTLAGAEAVAGPEAGRAVLRLVDCSLLVPPRTGADGQPRYVMLETLRGYGAQLRAEASEQDTVAAALAAYALQVAEEAAAAMRSRATEAAAARTLAAEDPVTRLALAWAAAHDEVLAARLVEALGWWWWQSSQLPGQSRLLGEIAGQAEPGSEAWCVAMCWLGQAGFISGDMAAGLGHYTALTDVLDDGAPYPSLADALAGLSAVLLTMGQLAEGTEVAHRSLAVATRLAYPPGQGHALQALGIAAVYGKDYDGAVQLIARQQLITGLPGPLARAGSQVIVAALAETGDLAGAERASVAALARCREAGDTLNLVYQLMALADLEVQVGRSQDAAVHLREGLQIALRVGDTWDLIFNGLWNCAFLCAATGRYAEAVTLWTGQNVHARNPGNPMDARRLEPALSEARQALGPERVRAAEVRGAAMSLDTAAEYALMLTASAPETAAPAPGLGRLSAREQELVTLVAQGHTNAQIAVQLFISVRTVGSHLDRIRDKTGCRRRADLTRLALTEGLV
jgi:predicted ATPase/DNA-binding CsgD family transcriptional regulator